MIVAITVAVHAQPQTATATFAGGCFWSMEHVFDELPDVVSVTAGYAGGSEKHAMQHRMYRIGCGRDARLRELWGK